MVTDIAAIKQRDSQSTVTQYPKGNTTNLPHDMAENEAAPKAGASTSGIEPSVLLCEGERKNVNVLVAEDK